MWFGGILLLPEEIALLAADAADDARGKDITIRDLRGLTIVADYFVICTAETQTQLNAIAARIKTRLAEHGVEARRREGDRDAAWTLLDYGDVVVHIFNPEKREFYDLDRLWGDAPEITVKMQGSGTDD